MVVAVVYAPAYVQPVAQHSSIVASTKVTTTHQALPNHRCSLSEITQGTYGRFKRRAGLLSSTLPWLPAGSQQLPCALVNNVDRSWRKSCASSIRGGSEPRGPPAGAAFDLDLGVLLAGFSFESYNTPPQSAILVTNENAAGCRTSFLTPGGRSLLHQMYVGELRVTAVGARDCPALDMWNASDPYALITLGDCRVRTATKPLTVNPNWGQTFTLYVKAPVAEAVLRCSVWDANLVAADRRMGVAALRCAAVMDGQLHRLELPLQEDYGQGRLLLEVRYNPFSDANQGDPSWLQHLAGWVMGLAPSFGTQSPPHVKELDTLRSMLARTVPQETSAEAEWHGAETVEASAAEGADLFAQAVRAWQTLRAGNTDQAVGSKPRVAGGEVRGQEAKAGAGEGGRPTESDAHQEALFEQGEDAVGPWALLASLAGRAQRLEQPQSPSVPSDSASVARKVVEEERRTEAQLRAAGASEAELADVRAVFRRAESAVEAWSLLAAQAGRRSAVQSDFRKLAFIEHPGTDTQVAIWAGEAGRRIVVAFRGTEQTQWRDLATDLMLVSAGLNPERVAPAGPSEPAVHAGFLRAYDSVRRPIVTLLEAMTRDESPDRSEVGRLPPWTVFVTGHSLGGALATLLARDLVRLPLVRGGRAAVVMYNYGSPRVGNRAFAEEYNRSVTTSWRVCNHRDIVPTVPRLLGYCHVRQPIYFRGDLRGRPLGNDSLEDDYPVDVIGETSADALLPELLRGEQALIAQLVRTEIALLQSLRDGSGIMQHMEDFYYTALLQVRPQWGPVNVRLGGAVMLCCNVEVAPL